MSEDKPERDYSPLAGWFMRQEAADELMDIIESTPKVTFVRKYYPVKNMHAELQPDGESVVWFEESE